jgi:hypothetical protein
MLSDVPAAIEITFESSGLFAQFIKGREQIHGNPLILPEGLP